MVAFDAVGTFETVAFERLTPVMFESVVVDNGTFEAAGVETEAFEAVAFGSV